MLWHLILKCKAIIRNGVSIYEINSFFPGVHFYVSTSKMFAVATPVIDAVARFPDYDDEADPDVRTQILCDAS